MSAPATAGRCTVAVAGAGLMGAQIGSEYALAGHPVVWVVRDADRARLRVESALAVAARFELAGAAAIDAARARMTFVADAAEPVALVVESVPEDRGAKVAVLRECAERWPDAILATNTSSLSVDELGAAAGAAERTLGTHYWNPPLLMPLVEVVAGERTAPEALRRVSELLVAIGKRPVPVVRDVPGFIWNRLQLALLREALWLVEHGVATPAAVDEVMRDGLARRWRLTGPFETVALGGAATFDAIAANLFPRLSNATDTEGFAPWTDRDAGELERLRTARDAALAAELRAERDRG